MTNIPATHDPRTDAQILEDKDKNKDLERGTVRDANGVPRDMRQFPAAPVESYSQYLARVSGLTDFTPLTEAQWRKETGQKTAEETILADLGIHDMTLLSNSHHHVVAIEGYGLNIVGQQPIPEF